MTDVLTKKFWQGVRKTFLEALEDPALKTSTSPPVAEVNPSVPADAPPSPESADVTNSNETRK
jgi:hypothetical protein